MNDETGDKMELYKCFICRVAFPSVTRLQAHLSQHKQRFVCSKCNFSCDSRVTFSSHVQREHLSDTIIRYPPPSSTPATSADVMDGGMGVGGVSVTVTGGGGGGSTGAVYLSPAVDLTPASAASVLPTGVR